MVYTGVRLVVNASQVSAPYHVGAKTSLATFNLGRPELTLGRRSMLSTGQECARTIAANASPALGCLGRYRGSGHEKWGCFLSYNFWIHYENPHMAQDTVGNSSHCYRHPSVGKAHRLSHGAVSGLSLRPSSKPRFCVRRWSPCWDRSSTRPQSQ
jgi:hypothetical protein